MRGRRNGVVAAVLLVVLGAAASRSTYQLGFLALLFVLIRFGLLPLMVSVFCSSFLLLMPLTFDSSVPYVSSSYLVLGTIAAIALYGLHTALAGRSIFGAAFLKDDLAPGRS